MTAGQIIAHLNLAPHPEGGFYRQTWVADAAGRPSGSWRMDETGIKVCGNWTYMYRAVDGLGTTIDYYVSAIRHAKAVKRFSGKALPGGKAGNSQSRSTLTRPDVKARRSVN